MSVEHGLLSAPTNKDAIIAAVERQTHTRYHRGYSKYFLTFNCIRTTSNGGRVCLQTNCHFGCIWAHAYVSMLRMSSLYSTQLPVDIQSAFYTSTRVQHPKLGKSSYYQQTWVTFTGKLSWTQKDCDCLLGSAVFAVWARRTCSKQYGRYPVAERDISYCK